MAAIMEVADDMNRTFQKFEPAPRRGEPEVRAGVVRYGRVGSPDVRAAVRGVHGEPEGESAG